MTFDDARALARPVEGSKIWANLLDALRRYPLAKGDDVTKVLTELEGHAGKLVKIASLSKEVRTCAETVLREAQTDLGHTVTVPAPAAVKAVAAVAPDELFDRLKWMRDKAREGTATEAQAKALPRIKAAIDQFLLVRARQEQSLDAQARGAEPDYRGLDRPEGGAGALSNEVASLFEIFSLSPHGFPKIEDAKKFGATVRAELGTLKLKLPSGEEVAGFGDCEVILSGSAVTGRALVAKKGAKEPRPFGDHSDFDVAVVSERLFRAVSALAPDTLRGQARTEPDPLPELAAISARLTAAVAREVSMMVFKTRQEAQRSPGLRLT